MNKQLKRTGEFIGINWGLMQISCFSIDTGEEEGDQRTYNESIGCEGSSSTIPGFS